MEVTFSITQFDLKNIKFISNTNFKWKKKHILVHKHFFLINLP